jgi:predicted ArsR family transcriptional regulator
MSLSQQLNEMLGHPDLSSFLAEQTNAINTAYATQQISDEERAALLQDLVNTNVVIQGANDQDTRIFIDRVIAVVMSAPIPS